jgi:hypothetical protein
VIGIVQNRPNILKFSDQRVPLYDGNGMPFAQEIENPPHNPRCVNQPFDCNREAMLYR